MDALFSTFTLNSIADDVNKMPSQTLKHLSLSREGLSYRCDGFSPAVFFQAVFFFAPHLETLDLMHFLYFYSQQDVNMVVGLPENCAQNLARLSFCRRHDSHITIRGGVSEEALRAVDCNPEFDEREVLNGEGNGGYSSSDDDMDGLDLFA